MRWMQVVDVADSYATSQGEAFQEGAGAGAGTGTGSHAVCGAEGVSLEKLYEENGSLKAISQYLMQERQDLMKKLETLSSQSNNMKILAKVLKHHIREAGGGGSLPGLDDGMHSRPTHKHTDRETRRTTCVCAYN